MKKFGKKHLFLLILICFLAPFILTARKFDWQASLLTICFLLLYLIPVFISLICKNWIVPVIFFGSLGLSLISAGVNSSSLLIIVGWIASFLISIWSLVNHFEKKAPLRDDSNT
jgi:hypothetical protein